MIALKTGFYAAPGKPGGLTHVTSGGKPICGYRPADNMEFQFCASGARFEYVECKRCKAKVLKIQQGKK